MGDSTNKLYRIGSVVKNLGLGQYTLKYYEKEGLIEPCIDEESGYRRYDYREFGKLIYLRNLRKMGFSLEGMKEVLDSPLTSLPSILTCQQEANNAEIARLQQANLLIERRRQEVQICLDKDGLWEQGNLTPKGFVHHFEDEMLSESLDSLCDSELFKALYEQSDIAIRIKKEEVLKGDLASVIWGFALPFDNRGPVCSVDASLNFENEASFPPIASQNKELSFPYLDVLPACKGITIYGSLVREENMAACLIPKIERALKEIDGSIAGDVLCIFYGASVRADEILMPCSIYVPIE